MDILYSLPDNMKSMYVDFKKFSKSKPNKLGDDWKVAEIKKGVKIITTTSNHRRRRIIQNIQ